ncbi:MAG: hypothetical protein DMF65_14605, partial [Acidobacteria bacterium]
MLLLALLAVRVSSSFDAPATARNGWHFPFAESFAFLSMMLFDGEAAVLLAASVALCASLPESKKLYSAIFRASVAAFTTFFVVWTLRLTSGVLTDIGSFSNLSPATLNAVCVAVLVQSLLNASFMALGGSYRINQSVLRDGTRTLFWQIVGNSAAFAAALFLAACVQFFGLNVSISVGAFACLLGFVVRAQFFGERNSRPAPATGEPREKTSESDRFRSAFDFAAIGMALVSTEGR